MGGRARQASLSPALGYTCGLRVVCPAPVARIAERLASVRNPFTATNDQLAIITWFQESAPAGGYGLGAVPWCGEIAGATCRGVPGRSRVITCSPPSWASTARLCGGARRSARVLAGARRHPSQPRDTRDSQARVGSRHAGVVELDCRVLGRPHACPAGHHGCGQPRLAAADGNYPSLHELRCLVAAREYDFLSLAIGLPRRTYA